MTDTVGGVRESVGRPDTPARRVIAALARIGPSGRSLVILVPYVWLLLFFLVPFAIVLKIALAEPLIARPPYSPLFEWVDGVRLQISLVFDNFQFILSDRLYILAYLNSVKIAFVSTVFTLLVGYPLAYAIARSPLRYRTMLLMGIILPFWTSFLIRVYAWIGILKTNGYVNNSLLWASGKLESWFGIDVGFEPIVMLHTDFSVYVGIVYSYLPFMVLPLYATLEKMDESLLEAAMDLGARPWKAFLTVTLPLSRPGIVAGSMLVFIPAIGEFVIPTLLGGPDQLMIGRVLWDEFFGNRDWPVASAVAVALLLILVVPIMYFQNAQSRQAERAS